MRCCLVLALALAACGKGDKPPPAQGQTGLGQESGPGQRKASHGGEPSEAEQVFLSQCARCHGYDGTGRGEVAATLNPKPRDYTDAAWQASVTDDDLKKIIVEGGQAVGKSVMMPPNPALKDKPHVVNELVLIIRGFAKRNK
jgi:cytochrome c553